MDDALLLADTDLGQTDSSEEDVWTVGGILATGSSNGDSSPERSSCAINSEANKLCLRAPLIELPLALIVCGKSQSELLLTVLLAPGESIVQLNAGDVSGLDGDPASLKSFKEVAKERRVRCKDKAKVGLAGFSEPAAAGVRDSEEDEDSKLMH